MGLYVTERVKNRVWYLPVGEQAYARYFEDNLNCPYGLAWSPQDTLIIADKMNHRLVEVSETSRVIQTMDTNGRRRSSCAHRVDYPWCPTSLCSEPDGSWLVSYSDDNAIYRIHPSGRLELVVGLDAGRHLRFSGSRDTIPAAEAHDHPLLHPTALIRDEKGGLYFVERMFQVIRYYHPLEGTRCVFEQSRRDDWKFDSLDQVLPDVLHRQEYHPTYPTSLAIDARGHLYIADALQQSVWRLSEDRLTRIYRSIAAGPAGPAALTWGPDQTLWILDHNDTVVVGMTLNHQGDPVHERRVPLPTTFHAGNAYGAGMTWGQSLTHPGFQMYTPTSPRLAWISTH